MRFHVSSSSIESAMAGNSTTRPPIAYIPMPASTVASSAILIRATRMPRIITSFIDHGCMWWLQRIISPTQSGAGGRRIAASTVSMKAR